jgi:hypothetical protein
MGLLLELLFPSSFIGLSSVFCQIPRSACWQNRNILRCHGVFAFGNRWEIFVTKSNEL